MLKNVKSCLSSAFTYAIEPLHYISKNPIESAIIPRYDQKILKREKDTFIVSKEIFDQLMGRFPLGNIFYLPLLIGYYTGLRIGECYGLTWDNISFTDSTLTVEKQLSKEHGHWYLRPPKTENSNRTIKIGVTLLEALKAAYHQQNIDRIKYGYYYTHIYKGNDNLLMESMQELPFPEINLICRRENGIMLNSESFKYCARVVHYELLIPEFHYHALRHTHGTIMAENGVSPVTVMQRLGHSSIEMTLKHYTFNTPKMEDTCVDIFEKHA